MRSEKQWHLRRRRGSGGSQWLGSGSGSRSGIVFTFTLLSFFGRGWMMLRWHTFFDGGTLPSGGGNTGWRGVGRVLLFAALVAGGGASSGRHFFFIRVFLIFVQKNTSAVVKRGGKKKLMQVGRGGQ